jgi:nitroreductase/ubiquinone/menaquinone biosynthesis C-methylase UbiE
VNAVSGPLGEPPSADVAAILAQLAKRRSCRAFDGSAMTRDVVEAIIGDGLAAPSSCNQQQWHFVAIDDPATKRQAQEIAGGNPHFLDAAVVIYLCFQKGWTHDKFSVVQSVAAACYHMMLSAHLRGFASIWNAGIGDTRQVAALLHIPPIMEIQGALCIGRARADAPCIAPPRRPLSAVMSWNGFARPPASMYPVRPARAYPYFAISNTRNPYAIWDPAAWGWERLADFRGYAVWNKSPLAGVFTQRSHPELLIREIAAMPDVAAGAHVLDVLPWGGTSTVALCKRYGADVQLHVAELSSHNHDFIIERIRQEGLGVANVHAAGFATGRLQVTDASIDAAFLPRVLEHLPDPWLTLDELRRVLKIGGCAVVSVRNRRSREGRRYIRETRKAQVPNTGPYRPLSALRVRQALASSFAIAEEFGLSYGEGDDARPSRWRPTSKPIYVARVVRER